MGAESYSNLIAKEVIEVTGTGSSDWEPQGSFTRKSASATMFWPTLVFFRPAIIGVETGEQAKRD